MSNLIQKMNAITTRNLSDPMIVNIGDWNDLVGEVRQLLEQLEQAKARVAELEAETEWLIATGSKLTKAATLRKQADELEKQQ